VLGNAVGGGADAVGATACVAVGAADAVVVLIRVGVAAAGAVTSLFGTIAGDGIGGSGTVPPP
jgi:hypothetical protein